MKHPIAIALSLLLLVTSSNCFCMQAADASPAEQDHSSHHGMQMTQDPFDNVDCERVDCQGDCGDITGYIAEPFKQVVKAANPLSDDNPDAIDYLTEPARLLTLAGPSHGPPPQNLLFPKDSPVRRHDLALE